MLACSNFIKFSILATFFANYPLYKPIYNYEKNFTFNAGTIAGGCFCAGFPG